MGCDIHMHVEVKSPNGSWSHVFSPWCPRNYTLFGYLAGVRHHAKFPMEPQGFPKDADYVTIEAYTEEIVSDEEYQNACESCFTGISQSKFEEYLAKGYVQRFDEKRIVGQDWHTVSHLNYGAFVMQLERAEREDSSVMLEYRAIANYMNTFESVDKETRIVFWFDN